MKKIWVVWVFLFPFVLWAQLPAVYHAVTEKYSHAVHLYENKNYAAAEEIFRELRKKPQAQNLLPDIDYYLLEIRLKTGDPEVISLINKYLLTYPYSPYKNAVMMHAVDYYFARSNWDKVRTLMDNMEVYQLSGDDRDRLRLYEGFMALKEDNLSRAKRAFKSLLQSGKYANDANYYLGYIAYKKNNLVQAQRYFSKIQQQRTYGKNIPYYNADMYYSTGQFEKAIEEALKIYPRARGKEKSELAKIIGSSYFNLGQYKQAIPYLKAYKGKKGKWQAKDYYELGYAYYKSGQCDKAIPYFNKIISGKDILAQNAYYHLAKCYLQSGNKPEALNAFKKVSELDFDKKIQEDAWYQYIKLAYEIGSPYETLDEAIKEYLSNFPGSSHKKELKDLLVSSYLTSHNYEAALKAMQKNRMEDRPEFQKVAFLRGMELFNEGKYKEALHYFDLSLRHGVDKKYRDKAVFWKAESLYRLGQYDKALTEYKAYELQRSGNLAFEDKIFPYNMGYVYFKLKRYGKAIPYFKKFLESFPPEKLKKDAYIRLADSYFATKKYWLAMENYNKAIALPGYKSDYAFYQKAVSYGFVGRPLKKIENLKTFLRKYPRSPLADDALYQLGATYLNLNKYKDAVSTFQTLVSRYPKSPYVPVALLKTGLAHYNANNNAAAKEIFKKLIRNYPKTPEAVEAADYLKNIYIDENNPDAFLAFIKQIPNFNIETSQLEKDIFSAAEQKYFEQDYEHARRAFETYLDKFPEGLYTAQVHHYLARIFQKLGNPGKAYEHYEKLAELPANEFSVEALRFLALENLKKKNTDKAQVYLEKLESLAQTDDDILFTVSNLMKIYAEQNKEDKAADYARKVIAHPKAGDKMKTEAWLILARSAMKNGDEAKAKEYYARLLKTAKGTPAAEAMYYKAYFEHKEGKYDASNKTISTLAKKYPSKKYWGGKALILMARNMKAKGDLFNATYILENVIKRFDAFPELVEEAKTLLETIKKENKQASESPSEKE